MDRMKSRHTLELSRLPTQRQYWDRLQATIASESLETLARYGRAQGRWWSGMATHSRGLLGLAAAAVVAGIAFMPATEPRSSETPAAAVVSHLGGDSIALLFLEGTGPPSMDELLTASAGGPIP